MKIVDLADQYLELYLLCLEDWSDEMKEASDHKRCWYERAKDEGLRVKLGLDDEGTVGGMIQYGPIEPSFADGHDLYVVYCIWVHGHKEGRGNFQHQGMGKALLRAAEEDVRQLGANGLAAWGVSLPFWMRASWFKRQGYTRVDKQGMQVLLWKPFRDDAEPPKWIRQRKRPQPMSGRVTVTAFNAGWCQAQNIVFERAKHAAAAFDDRVVFEAIDTTDRQTFLEWGISDGLYIDGKEIRTGPPPSYDKLHTLIAKRLKKL
ncbi:GNAT family N-acetyltransferase [Candidatus Bipolaricaulota bacterium]|nr:GNAT family N-acetyltransferase [Candidatus Bipolaricaulota bacterium]